MKLSAKLTMKSATTSRTNSVASEKLTEEQKGRLLPYLKREIEREEHHKSQVMQ